MECVEGFVNNPRNHPHPNSCRVQTSAQLSSGSLGHTFCTLSWSELCSVGGPFKTNPPTREPLAPLNEVSGSQREVSPYQMGSFLPSSALTSRRLNPILCYNRGRGRDAISRIWCTHTYSHIHTKQMKCYFVKNVRISGCILRAISSRGWSLGVAQIGSYFSHLLAQAWGFNVNIFTLQSKLERWEVRHLSYETENPNPNPGTL